MSDAENKVGKLSSHFDFDENDEIDLGKFVDA